MIPAEAVEAAAKAMYAQDGGVGEFSLSVYEDYAKAMLEAAAPHMLAGAKADALEEAATAFGEAASWSDSRPSPEQVQRWLRSRAATYRSAP